jgi:hypothetical protein
MLGIADLSQNGTTMINTQVLKKVGHGVES